MSIRINEDVIGGGGNYAGGRGDYGGGYGAGIFVFAILIIFIFAIFQGRRDGHGDHLTAMLPFLGRGGFGGGDGCHCPPKCTPVEDVAVANIAKEIVFTTGALKTQAAIDTGAIIHNNDVQTLEFEKCINGVIQNQNRLALDAERQFNMARMEDKNLTIAALTNQLTKQEIINNNDRQSGQLQHELDQIKYAMLKQPPFVPFGTFPAAVPFRGEFGDRDRDRDRCCC